MGLPSAPDLASKLSITDLLLERRGLVFIEAGSGRSDAKLIRAVELNLAGLGYVLSFDLQRRLATLPAAELARTQERIFASLAAQAGADRKHEPLFRRFPDGIPEDTFDLWLKKVACHFLQGEDQPCLFCKTPGRTHVLDPCGHVVCDRCFDGSSYSACPVCEHKVDRGSPFFRPAPERDPHRPDRERVRFKLLDLGRDPETAARALFVSLCERRQALSPDDRRALASIVSEYGTTTLGWLPAEVPVKENVAIVFGLLARGMGAAALEAAGRHFSTATDALRFLAAFSGADPSLQKTMFWKEIVPPGAEPAPKGAWWEALKSWIAPSSTAGRDARRTKTGVRTCRFRMARLDRPMRRAVLGFLEGLRFDRLMEDMLRHPSVWIWAGEFLHPFEHAGRFPRTALAFAVIRGLPPSDDDLGRVLRQTAAALDVAAAADGTLSFSTYSSRLEAAAGAGDVAGLTRILAERPGELARRLDHGFRVALQSGRSAEGLLDAFVARIPSMATPVMVSLASYLPRRARPLPVRIFFPKGGSVTAVSAPDRRIVLPESLSAPACAAIEAELLRRFAAKQSFECALLDATLRDIAVPFNERTASSAAVALPRGSTIAIPEGKMLRLFLHWCEPPGHGRTTDLDLSVGFYDRDWRYVGVCSYYQLLLKGRAGEIAKSAGDSRNAPFPDGATELVDVDRERALAGGIRYAAMVVTAYAGLPFGALERGFAGLMLRDDPWGEQFDPRTVELKFALQGEHGVFLPLVVDLEANVLHWLDAYNRGMFQLNNVENSKRAIARICPELIAYFASGVRPCLFRLAALHAAARSRTVLVRGDRIEAYRRGDGEGVEEFHRRIFERRLTAIEPAMPTLDRPLFAALYRGDLELPQGSECYALFRESLTPTIAASDLLSA